MEKPSWAQAHRSVAKRLLARRNDKEGLVDSLSWALETCCVQFPIVEAGEALDALDPFTFMAAWCRPMPKARKERLFLLACEALEVARLHLKPGGSFIVKIFMGPDIQEMLQPMRRAFKSVKSFKPKSSRAESKETFFVGMGFKAEARPAAQDAGTDGAADTGQEPGAL